MIVQISFCSSNVISPTKIDITKGIQTNVQSTALSSTVYGLDFSFKKNGLPDTVHQKRWFWSGKTDNTSVEAFLSLLSNARVKRDQFHGRLGGTVAK